MRRILKDFSKRKLIYTLCCTVICFGIFTLSEIVYKKNISSIDIFYVGRELIYFLFIFIIFWIMATLPKIKCDKKMNFKIKYFFVGWSIMFLFYIPALIAFAPGLLAYDTQWQTYQIFGIYPMTNHHPLLHTTLWKIFLNIGLHFGQLEVGILLYDIFQVLVMTAIFSYTVFWCSKNFNNKYFIIGIYLFFTLNPTFHLLITQCDKDVLFGGCMLLWTLCFIDTIREKNIFIYLFIYYDDIRMCFST